MNWHLISSQETALILESGARGISSYTAREKLDQFGANEIAKANVRTPASILLRQISDFMIIALIIASVISGMIGEIADTVIILAIVVLNTVIGFSQEYRAEKAIQALKEMTAATARVIRDGRLLEMSSSELVPGDLVLLEAGNIVPADIRLSESVNLQVNESALTGESVEVAKTSAAMEDGEFVLGEIANMIFKGTHVSKGRASGYVVATGMNTEFGKIARLIQGTGTMTPLQKRLADFGKRLSAAIFIICGLIFTLGLIRGEETFQLLLTAISLAVAAIPEALPAVVTIALAIGAKRMVKQNALIRKLPAVESLGSVTYICSDKTGTLTMNKMKVVEAVEIDHGISIPGIGNERLFALCLALNNDTSVKEGGVLIGDSTEIALAEYSAVKGIDREECIKSFPRISEIPFDSVRKKMTTIHKTGAGLLCITKGAAEILLEGISEDQLEKKEGWKKEVERMSAKGYRVLGLSVKLLPDSGESGIPEDAEDSMVFIGYAGMTDPPRAGVQEAVKRCKSAGVVPVMITGDHPATAEAIARQIGILENREDKLLTGKEVSRLDPEEFEEIVLNTKVYARVSPEEKLKIVRALQDRGQFVAMTGDGVNDAPALKNADIGVAMGISGTEVAKEASDMVLLDDNFSTIVNAIGSGRRIFDNILKFIKYVMTGNSGEIWTMLLAPFLGLPIPLLPIHLLWINLVTDGLPGLALASEPAEKNIMERKPRNPGDNIFSGGMAYHIIWVGLLIGFLCIGIQAVFFEISSDKWQTMVFTALCFCQIGHLLAIRSGNESLFKAGVFSNTPLLFAAALTVLLQIMLIYVPAFNMFFRTKPLSAFELAATFSAAVIVFLMVEFEKYLKRKKHSSKQLNMR